MPVEASWHRVSDMWSPLNSIGQQRETANLGLQLHQLSPTAYALMRTGLAKGTINVKYRNQQHQKIIEFEYLFSKVSEFFLPGASEKAAVFGG